jgi:hypothetical protein
VKPGDLVKFCGANKKKRFGIITEGPYGMLTKAGHYEGVDVKWNDGRQQHLDARQLEVVSEAR